ncbi:MAG: cbb3-type cytochrome c oxidase subunit I [Magnetococcales bacterium]|nr:cbb3-type cytochrome c oxidase subunit I [Magnetococcales bacterium]
MDFPSKSASEIPANSSLGWVWLGLSSLLLSSCLGLFLILSRTPWFSPWLATTTTGFSRALVYHVNFAVLIWFLSMTGALITRVYHSSGYLFNRTALVLTWGGTVILLFAGIHGEGQAVLSNYIPVLNNQSFLLGLSLLGLAAFILSCHGLSTLLTPWNMLRRNPIQTGVMAGSLAWFVALIAFFVVAWHLAGDDQTPPDFNTLFWAGGHTLQLAHVLLLLGVWLFLTQSFHPSPYSPWLSMGLLLSSIPAILSIIGLFFIDIPSGEYHQLFTNWMQYASWWAVPGTIVTVWPGWKMVRSSFRENNPVLVSVFLSIFLLIQGIVFGTMIEGDTVLVTAHYHAAVGAVTLGYMGLVRHLLAESRMVIVNRLWICWQPWMFGVGVFLLTSGLELSGIHGVERKIPGFTATSMAGILGMGFAGVGGSLAMAGVVIFSVFPLKALGRRWVVERSIPDFLFRHRLSLLIMTVIIIGIVAQLLEMVPSTNPQVQIAPENTTQTLAKETLPQRFLEGALLLQSKRFTDAAAVFHVILRERPRMPEAHVNMGYALLGLGKVRAALDFFQGALALNPYQTNAYFGLAVALESEGDLETALGAMRSFVHMSPDTDPWLPRARSAIWEWETALQEKRSQLSEDQKSKEDPTK